MKKSLMWIALMGVLRKEITRFIRIWPQSLLPSAITISLYFMIFGHVIGSKIGTMGGVDYITFITPGLIMMSIITNSYSNVVGSFYGARFSRAIEEMLVSPMPDWLIILGYGLGGLARGLAVGIIVVIISLIFSGLHVEHWALSILSIVLCSFLFSLCGLFNGIFARNFDDTAIVTTFVLTPLIYLGGVFYTIASLPPFWQAVSALNPLRYIIDLFRYAMIGEGAYSVWLSLCVVILCNVLMFALCYQFMKSGKGLKS